MMRRTMKIVMSIIVFVCLLLPLCIYALDKPEISGYLYDGSKDVDFNYEFNISDTFDIIYGNKDIEDYISEYIYSKIGDNYTARIDINDNSNNYTIYENDSKIYTGDFSYSLENKLDIELNSNDKINEIEKYIKDNTNYSHINISEFSNDIYIIEINNIKHYFEVSFFNNEIQDSNIQENQFQQYSDTSDYITNDYEASKSIRKYINYQTHVQNIGWQNKVYDGQMAGTSGKSLRQEAIKINLENKEYEGDIEYRSHIQNIGWESSWKKNGEMSGTSGKSLRLEAIQIRLTGEMEKHYDVYYRVHAQEFGWLDWAKNGEMSGTAGYTYRLEAIEIILVKKGSGAPGETSKPYIHRYVGYQTHVQDIGWQNKVYDGQMAGTSRRSLRQEAIKINLENKEYEGDIEYRSHIQNIGWESSWKKNGEISGTSGKSLRLEAIQIRLTGEMEKHYDVYYRVHAQEFGWLDWAKNGEMSGTAGYTYRLEAIEIILVKKGSNAPGKTETPFIKKYLSYQAHNSNIGWSTATQDGLTAGISGKNLEAYRINMIQKDYSGSISYTSYVNSIGWQNYVSDGTISGTTGKGKYIEAIKIKLTGEVANYYDIYYSVYISKIGWLDWAKNDQKTGNIGYGNSIQAIRVKLIEKGGKAPSDVTNIYSEDELKVNYNSYVRNQGWQNYVINGSTSGTTGQSKRIESIKLLINKKTITGSISYSTHISEVGWQNYVSDGAQSGIIGKRIEAIKIKLTGELANYYDVYYRTHVANVGWMAWACNDAIAGTTGAGRNVEAIQVILVEKGKAPPSNADSKTTSAYLKAHWETDSLGNRYYYDIYGNLVKSGGYKIGDTTHYFGATGIYLGDKNLLVIDVSAHQGNINWGQVAGSGIYGVILRISAGCVYEDAQLANNIAGVKKYNIPYGIYIYSYAENYNEGIMYGDYTNKIINKYRMNPTLGIYLDLESNGITQNIDSTTYTQIVKGYLSRVPSAKIYTYTNYANTALNTQYLRSLITWIADYRGYCGYIGGYKMWQYSSKEHVAGINGNVDMSILYV